MLAEFVALAMACAPQVHISTLQALVRTESRGHPYAININDGDRSRALYPSSQREAVTLARKALQDGLNIDVGWGQINSRNWEWLGVTVDTVFDPCTNLQAAQTVLADCYQRAAKRLGAGAEALVAGLSCYNTGNFRDGIKNGYVERVYAAANMPVPPIAAASADGLPPLPTPLASASAATNAEDRKPDAEVRQEAPHGLRDGFEANSVPDGFEANRIADGFEEPPDEARIQHIGTPKAVILPDTPAR